MKASERHRLKHDKAADTMMHGVAWGRHHLVPIIVAAVGILVIAVGIAWYFYTRQHAEMTAGDTLAVLQTRTQQEMGEKPTEQAQVVKKAVAQYDTLARTYADTDAAPLALLYAGQLLSSSNQKAEALQYFDRALAMAGGRTGLAMLARRGMAEALEDSGKLKEAIAQYEQFTRDGTSAEAVHAYWDIGRCYETLDVAKAKEYYEKAVSNGGETTWAKLARFRLAGLAQGAPTPVTAAAAAIVPPTPESVPAVTAAPAITPPVAPAPVVTMPAVPSAPVAPTTTIPVAAPGDGGVNP